MAAPLSWRGVARHLLQVLAFCAAVAVLTSAIWPGRSYAVQLGHALCIGLVTWAVIEFGRLMVPARFCHREGEGGPGWPRGWRGAALAAAGISAGFLIGEPLGQWLTGTTGGRSPRDGQLSLLITIAAGSVATFYAYMRGRAAALEASRAAAERDATEARLKLLQSQLEPHMLFNTLANLRALIGMDPPAAQQMLDRLNDFLRATLSASRATRHPLATEFERLDDYLSLMAMRMGPRLAYALHLPPELAALPVPPLLLQPLVENAIRHGLEPRVDGGRVDVAAAREGDTLVLTVQDTGVGFDAGRAARPGGFGMAQVAERVQSSYDGRGAVDLQSRLGGGTAVRLILPLEPDR